MTGVNIELYQFVVMFVGLLLTGLGVLALSYLNGMKSSIDAFQTKQEQILQVLAKHEARLDSIVASNAQREESLVMIYAEKFNRIEQELNFHKKTIDDNQERNEDEIAFIKSDLTKIKDKINAYNIKNHN